MYQQSWKFEYYVFVVFLQWLIDQIIKNSAFFPFLLLQLFNPSKIFVIHFLTFFFGVRVTGKGANIESATINCAILASAIPSALKQTTFLDDNSASSRAYSTGWWRYLVFSNFFCWINLVNSCSKMYKCLFLPMFLTYIFSVAKI